MFITEIEIENVKSITKGKAIVSEGVNFIHGPNGAGKSTILDALAFALYGSDWLRKVKTRLSDVVRVNTKYSVVRVKFVGIDGKKYLVQRVISPEKTIELNTYILTEDGKRIATRDKEVTRTVEKLTGLSLNIFYELLYIRQGEIRTILDVNRRSEARLDKLLKLEAMDKLKDNVLKEAKKRIEMYIKNLEGKLTIIEREISIKRKELENVEREYKSYREKLNNLIQRINELDIKRRELETQLINLKNIEKEIQELEYTIRLKSEILEELRTRYEDTIRKVEKFQHLRRRINELENELKNYEELKREISELELRRNEILLNITRLKELETRKNLLLSVCNRIRDEINSLKLEMKNISNIKTRYDELLTRLKHIDTLKSEFKNIINREVEIRSKISEIERKLSLLRSNPEKCPLCHQTIDKQYRIKLLDMLERELKEMKNELENTLRRREYLEKEISKEREILKEVSELKIKLETQRDLVKKLRNLEEELEKNLEEVKYIDNIIDNLKCLEDELKRIEQNLSRCKEIYERLSHIREEYLKLIGEYENLKGIEELKSSLERQIQLIEQEINMFRVKYENLRRDYENYLNLKLTYDELVTTENKLNIELSSVEAQLRTFEEILRKYKDNLNRLINDKQRVEKLLSKYDDSLRFIVKLINVLENAKPHIRRAFLESINEELNNTFLEVRHKSSFIGIRVDESYNIYVKRSDGVEISVDSLSVGERNLIALLFRYALAKTIMGNVPLLILDEPTEHLDDEHRRKIAQWIRNLTSNVDTVIVTSHIDAFETIADNTIKVEVINDKGESTFKNL